MANQAANSTEISVNGQSSTTFTLPISSSPATVIITTTAPPSTVTPTPTFTPTPSTTSIAAPSSTPVPTTAPPQPQPSIITSVITKSNSENTSVQIIVVTSTAPPLAPIGPPTVTSPSVSSTSSSTAPAGAATTTSAPVTTTTNSGLSPGGKIAVAVVVPIVAIALIIVALLFLWRRRRQRKDEEELRRKEVEEYGYNPNHDPTLPAVGVASNNGDEISDMRETDGAGYRGWGNTSANRKPPTNLTSVGGPIGIAVSDNGSGAGYHSPTGANTTPQYSDAHSGDPLVSPIGGRPTSGDSETIAALGAVPAAAALGARNDRDKIHRGPSNASSAYSGANRSEESGEAPLSATTSSPQYYNDAMYYDQTVPQHGPYADGSYGPAQPVIRDVQARRNTKIENSSIPQQRNASIAQNF